MYVNGSRVANDVTDYYTQHPYGTTYTINDCRATTGHTYNGVSSGSASGTIGTGNVSVQMKFTTVNYSISYNLDGGSISGQKTSYNVSTASFTLPTPSKSNCTFDGWTGTGLSAKTKTVTVSKGSTGNRSYTANWTCKKWYYLSNPHSATNYEMWCSNACADWCRGQRNTTIWTCTSEPGAQPTTAYNANWYGDCWCMY